MSAHFHAYFDEYRKVAKLIYASKYQGTEQAHTQRQKLLWQTAIVLPLRLLAYNPRLLARMWGRLQGVLNWKVR